MWNFGCSIATRGVGFAHLLVASVGSATGGRPDRNTIALFRCPPSPTASYVGAAGSNPQPSQHRGAPYVLVLSQGSHRRTHTCTHERTQTPCDLYCKSIAARTHRCLLQSKSKCAFTTRPTQWALSERQRNTSRYCAAVLLDFFPFELVACPSPPRFESEHLLHVARAKGSVPLIPSRATLSSPSPHYLVVPFICQPPASSALLPL